MTFMTRQTLYASGAAHVAHDGKVYGGTEVEIPVNIQCNYRDQFDHRGKTRRVNKTDYSRFHVSLRDYRGGRRRDQEVD